MVAQESALSKRYRAILVACYNHAFNTNHPKSYQFTNDELLQLKPLAVYAYLAEKAYGTSTPTDADVPTNGRSNTIAFAKKAISFFMPNRLMVWNADTEQGNPTRSSLVNNLIKRVKKQEVWKQGKELHAHRAM